MLIEACCSDLSASLEALEWDDMPTNKGLKPDELADELARQSVPRLKTYFRYYYTLHGNKRHMPASEGNFDPELRSSRTILEDFKAQLPYLLPEGAPGPDKGTS